MYNGGIFGGGYNGPLGVGVPSGWGNVDDTDEDVASLAKEVLKRRATAKESDNPKTMKMRNDFLGWFPKANKSKFSFTEKGVSRGGKRIFPTGMPKNTSVNKDLGISPSFPPQLQSSAKQTYLFPNSKGVVNSEVTIHHSQSDSTVVRFRDVFKSQQIKFTSSSECKKWKAGPNWKYWPQQLNLATWCATGGCGIGVDWNDFSPDVRSLLKFHVIFTIRRLLYEMGCALPDDTGFNQINNTHNLSAIERIKKEFNAPTDFRNKRGSNGGLGDIHAQFFYKGEKKSDIVNLKPTTWSNSWPQNLFRFRDEGLSDFKVQRVIQYILNSETHQEGWFMLRESYGLTMAGKGRLNRSIEAFVYCVLGAQVNMRSSITGQSGSAQEVKQELINLFEKAIIEEELSVSAQRYQTAIQSSRAKLDFALAPGLWLLPSDLEINLTRKVRYNNFLRKATEHMKLGVNNVNATTPTHDSSVTPKQVANVTPTRDSSVTPKQVANITPSTTPTYVVKGKQKKLAEIHNDNLATIAIVAACAAWWVFR